MNLVRRIFFLKHIYTAKSAFAILYDYSLIALAVAVFVVVPGRLHADGYGVILQGLLLILLLGFLRTIIRSLIVWNLMRGYPTSIPSFADRVGEAANLELNTLDRTIPLYAGQGARASVAVFVFNRSTKYGDYVARRAFYSVCEVELNRSLPHIIFDSRQAKSRQFKSLFLQVQRISVQGGFDEKFDTYVPDYYAIDSLSFITPEVMEVILEAQQYDIEIVGNKLFTYGPLVPEEDMIQQSQITAQLAADLDDNIDTYRDDRLSGEARKTSVTPFARELLQSPVRSYLLAGIFGAATIAILVASFVYKDAFGFSIRLNQVSLFIYILFATNLYTAVKITRKNRAAYRAYRAMLRGTTTTSQPTHS